MTIVFLIIMGLERPSGRRYFSLARALAQRGHRVRILALHPDLERCPQRRFVQDNVEVWYVGQMHARERDGAHTRFAAHQLAGVLLQSTCGMIWGILCSPATIYHLGKPQPVNGLTALLGISVLRRQGFYVDCDDDETTSNRFDATWQRKVFAFWQWLLPRLAQGVTVNTRFLASQIPRPTQKPVVYVPNGVCLEAFRRPPAPVLAALRAALGLHGRPVVAYSGALALHNHPVDLLLEAFVKVSASLPEAMLLLIGSGEDDQAIRERVAALGLQQHVMLVGYMAHRQTRAFLALAELSVDPVYDNDVARARSPLKIFESLALGVPVVTGDVGDRRLMLANGQAGVLVAPGDPAALAAGILSLVHNETTRRQMAAYALSHVRRYSWHVLAEQWETVYVPAV